MRKCTFWHVHPMKLKSPCASMQSDHSLLCSHEKLCILDYPNYSDQTAQMHRLIGMFAGHRFLFWSCIVFCRLCCVSGTNNLIWTKMWENVHFQTCAQLRLLSVSYVHLIEVFDSYLSTGYSVKTDQTTWRCRLRGGFNGGLWGSIEPALTQFHFHRKFWINLINLP